MIDTLAVNEPSILKTTTSLFGGRTARQKLTDVWSPLSANQNSMFKLLTTNQHSAIVKYQPISCTLYQILRLVLYRAPDYHLDRVHAQCKSLLLGNGEGKTTSIVGEVSSE